MNVPSHMRAALLTGHGGYEKLVVRNDVPVPRPEAREVLIKVGAAAVNNTDIWTREGRYPTSGADNAVGWKGKPLSFPRIQGIDVVGTIVNLGEGVSDREIGERVLIDPSIYDAATESIFDARLIGSERDGGFAEFMVAPSENAVRVNSPLSDVELATFPASYRTAEHMLNRAGVKAGDRVLITGASGGVGSALVQLCLARGARPSAIVGAGKEKRAVQLGAERVFTRNDAADIMRTIGDEMRHTFDVVADVVGGDQFEELLGFLRKGGRCVVAGAIGGASTQLDLRRLYLNHLSVIGSSSATHEELRDVVRHIEAGKLRPLVDRVYDLGDIHEAQRAFVEKRHFGKIVLRPAQ